MNGGSGLSQPVAETRHEVRLRVNGVEHVLRVPARRLLADALRHDLGLTGTHLGCEHGVCGACTVLLDGAPVRSCLLFAVGVDGAEITTVEGCQAPDGPQSPGPAPAGAGGRRAGEPPGGTAPGDGPGLPQLGPVQQAFADCHALQCGFCTPGFVTTVTAYLRDYPDPTEAEAREAIGGNLCRCTGYQNIVAAVLRAAEALPAAARTRAAARRAAGAPARPGPPPGPRGPAQPPLVHGSGAPKQRTSEAVPPDDPDVRRADRPPGGPPPAGRRGPVPGRHRARRAGRRVRTQ